MDAAKATRIHPRLHAIAGPVMPSAPLRRQPSESGAVMMRPSSARRRVILHTLVAELGQRDIGRAGAAALLECSLSASRNYLEELLDAGVVFLRRAERDAGCGDRMVYRLTTDALAVHGFLAGLAEPFGAYATTRASHPEHVQRRWRDAASLLSNGNVPARRDPLVAALFGAAGHS